MIIIQPAKWLRLVGETQDARDYFNDGLVASAPPYQNRWDIRQAYAQLGDPIDGWFDVSGGRRMQSYGEERLVGPLDCSTRDGHLTWSACTCTTLAST